MPGGEFCGHLAAIEIRSGQYRAVLHVMEPAGPNMRVRCERWADGLSRLTLADGDRPAADVGIWALMDLLRDRPADALFISGRVDQFNAIVSAHVAAGPEV